MRLVIYEDRRCERFYPLTEMHAAWDLRLGDCRLGERILRDLQLEDCTFAGRHHLAEVMAESGWDTYAEESRETLFVNALAFEFDVSALLALPTGERLVEAEGATVAFRLAVDTPPPDRDDAGYLVIPDLPASGTAAQVLREPWDLLTLNAELLESDFRPAPLPADLTGVILIAPERIALHPEAVIRPGAVLDGSRGPVTIGARSEVDSQAVIQGPVHIDADCRIKPHSHLYDATSVGPACRLAGEVENTICHSYVNKQHQGFVGHSLLMPWTNLGADTNTSDLKNNYGEIRLSRRGETVDTGRRLLGLLLGDHGRCAINTQFNSGSVGGVFANIFDSGFPPKEIPPFSWGGQGAGSYRLEEALAVAERVLARREMILTSAMRDLIVRLHDEASTDR